VAEQQSCRMALARPASPTALCDGKVAFPSADFGKIGPFPTVRDPNWIVEQNRTPSSPYFGKLDPSKVGSTGHSQGGGAVIAAAGDQAGPTGITVTAPIMPCLTFGSDMATVGKQHGPMLEIAITLDPFCESYTNPIFDRVNVAVVQAINRKASGFLGHLGVNSDPVYRAPITAWFRLHLMCDETARSLFAGLSCALCIDPTWQVKKMGF